MPGTQLELANPNLYDSPRDYVEKHLVPIAAELHRIINELSAPGSTSVEEWGVDMVPGEPARGRFSPLDARLDGSPKHVVFEGAEYLKIPTELLRSKQLKVQLSATVYVKGRGSADFRLVDERGFAITGSEFRTPSPHPVTITCQLPFGNAANCVAPEKRKYIIQARSVDPGAIPVCRRFSMSFVYI